MEPPQESPGFMRTASYFLRSRDTGASKGDSPSPMPVQNQPRPLFPTSSTQQSASGAGALRPDGRPSKVVVTFGAGGRYPSRKNPSETSRKRSAADSGARSGRLKRLRTATAATAKDATLTGYLGVLPTEVLEKVLNLCVAPDLGCLEATCTYFLKTGITESIARSKLKEIPRARGLKPEKKNRETHVSLLNFVNCQSQAAAQSTAVAFGAYHSASLLIPGDSRICPTTGKPLEHSLYSFGRGFHGQLGQGDYETLGSPSPLELSTDTSHPVMPAVVACGSSHTGSISRRGELFTWGLASSGELGHTGWTPIELNCPTQVLALARTRIVSVTAGNNHTLAISEFGHLWTCGRGRHGQLGHGAFHDEGPLMRVDSLVGCRIVSAAAGAAHSLALASDGSLFTWGSGQYGQLGHKRMKAAADMAVLGGVVATSEPEMVADLDPEKLKPPNRITAITTGSQHSMALTVGGNLLVFGRNSSGCLGLGDLSNRWTPTKVNMSESLPKGSTCRVVQVTGGHSHTLCLVEVNGRLEVRTAGNNYYGQLGHNDTKLRRKFTTVEELRRQHVVSVSAGSDHSGAVDCDGRLFVWGRGELGQLGLGDFRSHWAPKALKGFRVVHPDRTLRRNRTTNSM